MRKQKKGEQKRAWITPVVLQIEAGGAKNGPGNGAEDGAFGEKS